MPENIYAGVLKEEMRSFGILRNSQGFVDKNRCILRALDKYLVVQAVSAKELLPDVVDGWIAERCGGLAEKTRSCYIAYYTQFARYLCSLGIYAFIPENRTPNQTYTAHAYTGPELAALFRAADNMSFGQAKSKLLYPMLLRVLYGCGLRLGEALNLRLSDIDLATGVLFIRNAKGHKDRLVPMDVTLTTILSDYCRTVHESRSGGTFLFETDSGQAKSPNWAQSLFYKVVAAAGLERYKMPGDSRHNICLHSFRHTFAVDSFRQQDIAGIDNYRIVPLLSIYLGHEKLLGTQKYLHMSDENAKDILRATDCIAKQIFPEVVSK
jgi:integrase